MPISNRSGVRRRPRRTLLFIDTNILLDFYRGYSEATLSLLQRLTPVKEHIISTYQVEMEFLKNRQRVIVEALSKLKPSPVPQLPAFLTDSKTTKSFRNSIKATDRSARSLHKRSASFLRAPHRLDIVYRTAMNIFHSESPLVLTRSNPARQRIKRLAWRRFILGYPPRKVTDTSIGDALNWEWILACASAHSGRVVIVSRDGDFGIQDGDRYYLNDQLFREFRDRVGPRKSIGYTMKLSHALKELDVQVPKNEVEAEDKALVEETESKGERRQNTWAAPQLVQVQARIEELVRRLHAVANSTVTVRESKPNSEASSGRADS